MSGLYGVPYMGSKTKIAPDIIRKLPKGERFVDLFGGGFAMSHAALLSRRYKQILYNDFNPLIVELIKKGLRGDYNYSKFKPAFITREIFDREKENDPYIKYIWSFGSNGQHYLFGKEIEPLKAAAHNFVVFGKYSEELKQYCPKSVVTAADIYSRRMQFCGYCKAAKKRFELEQLERLQQLELSNISFEKYEHRPGDVVYCDPPYEGTADYGQTFPHTAFYEWAFTRDYPVYFSSYQISDKRFKLVWAKRLTSSFGGGKNSVNFECLYVNR